jgi:thioredoxin-dependent peroxiredoxin
MRLLRTIAPVLAIAAASQLAAQQTAEPASPLEVGAVAPDFALAGATRYGVLQNQVHLSDYKGKTVVLAFFFKARTRG